VHAATQGRAKRGLHFGIARVAVRTRGVAQHIQFNIPIVFGWRCQSVLFQGDESFFGNHVGVPLLVECGFHLDVRIARFGEFVVHHLLHDPQGRTAAKSGGEFDDGVAGFRRFDTRNDAQIHNGNGWYFWIHNCFQKGFDGVGHGWVFLCDKIRFTNRHLDRC